MSLKIGRSFKLPVDTSTEAIAILARRGRGKTYAAAVYAEELHAANIPFVVLDPTGGWFGLRSSADGKKPGIPVTIVGGDHGDVPLEPTAGKLLASFVVDNPGGFVIDLSSFESNSAQDRFVTDFAERLYRAKTSDRSPLTLIVDEADSFAPQRPMPGQQRMLGAFEAIVRRGRIRGLGVVLITQRPAVLNKNVLTQAGLLILLGITSPQDRGAVDDWIKGHATPEDRAEVMNNLARLNVGEAYVWWPTEDVLVRDTIRARRTFDSSATPKAGDTKTGPVAFAAVDLDGLKTAIADTIERERQRDPDILRARIRELENELADRPTPEPIVERVEVRVPDLDLVVRLENALSPLSGLLGDIQEQLRWDVTDKDGDLIYERTLATPDPSEIVLDTHAQRRDWTTADTTAGTDLRPRTVRPIRNPPATPDMIRLGKGEQTVLNVLAEYPDGRTYDELAFLARYSAKASTLGVILSNLRKNGWVHPGNQPVRPTEEGLAMVGGPRSRPTGPALLDQWMAHPRMGEGERRVLRTLIDRYPDILSHDELCELTGYSPSASTMGVILSKLRKLGLVEKGARRAAREFMDAIR